MKAGEMDKALAFIQKALPIAPEDPVLHANLGKVMEWTIHRSLAREWAEQLHSVFERLATPRPGRGGGTDDTQEAA